MKKYFYILLTFFIVGSSLATDKLIAPIAPNKLVKKVKAVKPPQTAIASANKYATTAGMATLAKGGNAFDAAITVASVLAVTEPYGSGIGGGGFFLLHTANDDQNIFLDARETAPYAAKANMYLGKDGKAIRAKALNGAISSGIPGIPAALIFLAEKYGNLSLKEDLQAAISYARNGFPVDVRYQRFAKMRLRALKKYPSSSKIFLSNKQVPKLGFLIKQTDLAATLTKLTIEGRKSFYTGKSAQNLVAKVRKANGIWHVNDLEQYKLRLRPPLVANYAGYSIVTAPPPSAGGVAIITILNILSNYDMKKLTRLQRIQVIVEAMRRAYWQRAQFLGDPDFVKVPLQQLLSKQNAANLKASISLKRATPSVDLSRVTTFSDPGENTTHFSILDANGNMVGATLTINYLFGSGFVIPGTGILLNDEMDDFSSKVGVKNLYGLIGSKANAIAPGKRPLSSMSPTFIFGHGKAAILGTPGGSKIPTMNLLAILDFVKGTLPQSWVRLPRYHHQYIPDKIFFEPKAFDQKTRNALTAKGYKLTTAGRDHYGNMQALLWDKQQKQVSAASDPRGVGKAEVAPVL